MRKNRITPLSLSYLLRNVRMSALQPAQSRHEDVVWLCFFLIMFCFCCVSQWFEDKFQEVENEEQQLRKLHALVDSLVNHRKGEIHLPYLMFLCLIIFIVLLQL